MSTLNMSDGDCVEKTQPSHAESMGFVDAELPRVRQDVSDFPVVNDCRYLGETRLPDRQIWYLDSDIDIDLDRPCEKRVSPELDLRVPPRYRTRRTMRTQGSSVTLDRAPNCTVKIENEQCRTRQKTKTDVEIEQEASNCQTD